MSSIDRYSKVGADITSRRSRFPMSRRVSYSYFHGYLHPVGSPIEVLPGDTLKAALSVFVRMSTPIVPFIDDVRFESDAFFVPKRILFDKTKQFYGESPSFGIASPVEEPKMKCSSLAHLFTSSDSNLVKSESIAAAFGLCLNGSNSNNVFLNVLPIRALFSIYNEYYRNENYQNQYTWDKSQAGSSVLALAFLGGSTITGMDYLPRVNKDADLITSILPYQIKGAPIYLSMAGNAPVIGVDSQNTPVITEVNAWAGLNASSVPYMGLGYKKDYFNYVNGVFENGSNPTITKGPTSVAPAQGTTAKLVADMSNLTSVGISDLLYALAYQDFLSRAAHFGTRYKEYIYSMFGTIIADATEDIPEYLGRLKFSINVNQVVQTTGFAASPSTQLGSLGAYSVSGDSKKLFTKSFTEPGYIVIVAYTKHQRTFSSGVDRVFLKTELLDYYQPPFANIPDVPIDSQNIWFTDTLASVSDLGFQEPFWDNRILQDRVYGMMNPMIDSLGEIWTCAEKWTAKPTIADAFMIEDRDCISRVLATGINGPDYLIDTRLDLDATRVMPLYSSGKLGRF